MLSPSQNDAFYYQFFRHLDMDTAVVQERIIAYQILAVFRRKNRAGIYFRLNSRMKRSLVKVEHAGGGRERELIPDSFNFVQVYYEDSVMSPHHDPGFDK